MLTSFSTLLTGRCGRWLERAGLRAQRVKRGNRPGNIDFTDSGTVQNQTNFRVAQGHCETDTVPDQGLSEIRAIDARLDHRVAQARQKTPVVAGQAAQIAAK